MRPSPSRRPTARRAVGTTAVLGLLVAGIGSLNLAPAVAAPAPTRHTAAAPSALTAERALAQARLSGKDVQATEATTETSTLTAHPNGTFTIDQAFTPVRKRSHGTWLKLDPTLRKNSDGTISTTVSTNNLTLSAGGSGPLATMSSGGRSLALTLPMPLPAPTLSGATAAYPNVLNGVDLSVTANAQGGFSEVLIVKDAAAASNPALRTLTLAVHTRGVQVTGDHAGNITARDHAGHSVFTAPAPQMWDSTAQVDGETSASSVKDPISGRRVDRASGQPRASTTAGPGKGAHRAPIAVRATNNRIDLTPSASLLTGPHTVYPVYIDPTVNPSAPGTRQAWTQINSYYHASSYWNSNDLLRVGDQYWDTPTFVARSFVQVGVPSQIYGSTVQSAQINFTEEWAPSCTATSVELWRSGGISAATTWDNPPSLISQIGSQSAAHGWNSSCPADGVGFDIGSLMQTAANNRWGNITFGLKAADETDSYGWKEFANTITASITYDHAPNTPTNLTTSPATSCQDDVVVGDGDVTLYAGVSDPDGGTVGTHFQVWPTGSTSGNIASSNPQTLTNQSGSTAVFIIPKARLDSVAGGKIAEFSWNTQVTDFTYTSNWSTTCHFSFDPTRPGAPVVPQPTGTVVGQPYSVTINPPATGVPNSYEYQVNGGAPANVLANSSGTATITIKPTRRTNVLTVSSMTAGSNYGNPASVTFDSANTATPQADGDLTGDSIPDLLTVGGNQNGLPSGIWLANGEAITGRAAGDGHIVAAATDIGRNGNGFSTSGGPSDFNGASVITGQFTDSGFQDVLVYYPKGDSKGGNIGGGNIINGNGDGSALATQDVKDVHFLPPNVFQDMNSNNPSQLANAGHTSGAPYSYPDLIGIAGDTLNLYPSQGSIATYGILPLTATPPDGSQYWSNWTIATMQLPGANGTSSTAMFLWKRSTGELDLWENLAADSSGKLTYTAYPIATGWNTGANISLQAADINGDGSPDLWTVGSGGTATANLFTNLSTTATATLAQNADTLSTPSHAWSLNDALTGSITTAADTAGSLNATGSGGATWATGDMFFPTAHFNGTGILTTTGSNGGSSQAVPTNGDFTVSAWVKPQSLGGFVLGQRGTHTSGFAIFSDASTKSWRFEMPTSDADNPNEDVAAAITIPAQVGAWVRLTATYQASTGRMALYLNDVAAAQATHTSAWNATGALTAGAYLYNDTITGHFWGNISDVETYPQALTAKQVAVLAGNPGPTSYAHINDGHDFNGDGNADVVAQWADGTLHLYAGAPGSQLVPDGQIWDSTWGNVRLMTSGNFTDSLDHNGDIVAIWKDGTAHLYTSDGNGHLTNAGQLTGGATWGSVVQIAAGDFTGDGHTDLLAIWGDGSVHIYPGDGKGNIGAAGGNIWNDNSWSTMKLLGAGDYNNDGHCDLLAEWSDGSLHLYTGDGNGHLTQGTQMYGGNTWSTVKGIIPGDFNHDGLFDLVAVWGDGTVHLYTGDGNGHLSAGPTMWPDNTWSTMGLIA